MTDFTIPALTAGVAVTSTDLYETYQGAAPSVKVTAAQLKTFMLGSTSAPTTHPQGRLTLTSNTPVMIADATAQASVYYTPYIGALIPIFDGTNWNSTAFTQLTMALDTTNQLLNNVYDLLVWNNAGTVAIGAGPAWSNTATITMTIAGPGVVTWTGHGLAEGAPVVFTTTGALPTGITAGTTYFVGRSPATNTFNVSTTVANAAAGTFITTSGTQSGTHTGTNGTTKRGTGAGTTQLSQTNGIWTNTNTITLTNGAGAGTSGIAANTATYVGSIFCTANGQTGMAFEPAAAAGGGNNFLAVWNAYNRVRVFASSRDTNTGYTYGTSTWRAANAATTDRITYLDGLAQSPVGGGRHLFGSAPSAAVGETGMTLDATNVAPQTSGMIDNIAGGAAVACTDRWNPALGMHYIQAVEWGVTANTTWASVSTNQIGGTTINLDM